MSKDWTDQEMVAAVDAYFEMLGEEIAGRPYKKSEYRKNALSSVLQGRSASSFEFRMRNISS